MRFPVKIASFYAIARKVVSCLYGPTRCAIAGSGEPHWEQWVEAVLLCRDPPAQQGSQHEVSTENNLF